VMMFARGVVVGFGVAQVRGALSVPQDGEAMRRRQGGSCVRQSALHHAHLCS